MGRAMRPFRPRPRRSRRRRARRCRRTAWRPSSARCSFSGPQNELRENCIEHQHGDGCRHHGLRGRPADPLSSLLRVETDVAGDDRDCPRERVRLDERVPQVEGSEEVARAELEVGVGQAQRRPGRDVPDHDTEGVGQHHERRDRDQSRQDPGQEQVGNRRAAEAFERVDLLGHPHTAQLGGVAGADPAGEDQSREHGAQLENHRFRDDSPGDIERELAGELVAGLQAGHGAGEPGHEQHDKEAAVADAQRQLEGAGDPDAPLQDAAHQVQQHKEEAPGMAGAPQGPPPDISPQVEGGSECSHWPVSCVAMSFTRKLLAWYKRNARVLPWRKTRNPYAVLVSEFMLQQTQVSRVSEFYPRFLKRFPTFGSLARSQPKAVMEAWDGLGYYARARNLHRLAREVTRLHDGTLPDKPEDLRTLPGVGRYTAGAVACFAYEKPVATVDTNVRRVLERAFGSKDVWELAERLVPKKGERAGRFNQALMELGALLCTGRTRKCPECPVRSDCRAVRSGIQIRNRQPGHPR